MQHQHHAKTYEQLLAELEQVKSERDRVADELAAARQEAARARDEAAERLGEQARELTERAAFLENLIEHTPAGIAYLDKHLVWRIINPIFEQISQAPARQEFIGRYIFDVLPGTEAQIEGLLRGVLETGVPYRASNFEYVYERDGQKVVTYWDFIYQPVILDPAKGVEGILVLAHDTSKHVEQELERQRHAEALQAQQADLSLVNAQLQAQAQALLEQKAFVESIIYNTPAAIAYLDRELLIRISNQANSQFLGIPNELIVGRHIQDVLPGGGKQLAGLFRNVLETRKPHTETDYELTYHMPDGTERTTYWDFGYYPVVLNDADGAVGVLSVSQEVSVRVERDRERQKALSRGERLRAMEESDRLKDQFLGILSHELRTPLNAILGFGSILADGVAGELKPEQAKYVGKILDSSDVMLGLVDDLLDMSRVQAGKFALDRQTIEVAPLVRSTLANLAAEAMKKGHSLVNEVPVTLPPVKADPRRVSQVLSNLVTNAVKYTPEGGTIRVRAKVQGEGLCVEVADTGLGVSADQQTRIFQAFTQVDMTNTRAKGGVGLGLSIVKALVEAHGGEVGVSSRGEGEGSTFWFTLPFEPPRDRGGQHG
jgi:signal transduction histidine kinase